MEDPVAAFEKRRDDLRRKVAALTAASAAHTQARAPRPCPALCTSSDSCVLARAQALARPGSPTPGRGTSPLALTPLLNSVALGHAAVAGPSTSAPLYVPPFRAASPARSATAAPHSSALSAQLASAWADELVAARAAAVAQTRKECAEELAALRERCARSEAALASSDVSARQALASLDSLASQVSALEADSLASEASLRAQVQEQQQQLDALHGALQGVQAAWRRDVSLLEAERDAAKAQSEHWKAYAQHTDAEAVALVASAHEMVRTVMLDGKAPAGGGEEAH